MKRPYIPLKVRLAVLERQAFVDHVFANADDYDLFRERYAFCCYKSSTLEKIKWLLSRLFPCGGIIELDHDPALELRRFNKRTGKYSPDANNPRYLVYRRKDEHLQKTMGRKPGAERTVTTKGSDVWVAKKFRKLRSPKKSKSKIPSRPFPKTRSSFATRVRKGF